MYFMNAEAQFIWKDNRRLGINKRLSQIYIHKTICYPTLDEPVLDGRLFWIAKYGAN